MPRHDLITIAAVGVLAFIAVDLAHEVVGHGVGLLLGGGRGGVFTTTKLIAATQLPDPQWRIFDVGGPSGNLLLAALSLLWLRLSRKASTSLRWFLWSSAMFGMFWEFGYLMKCGLVGAGDYMALIAGLKPAAVLRTLMFLAGLVLYRSAMSWLGSNLHFVTNSKTRLSRLLFTIYLAGGFTACAGTIFDPRGPSQIFESGFMSSFAAALGLLLVPTFFARSACQEITRDDAIPRSFPLIACALASLLFFVFLLGRGIPFAL